MRGSLLACATAALLSVLETPLFAQVPSGVPTAGLTEIRPGHRVRVVQHSPLQMEGKWLYARADSIALETQQGALAVALDSVRTVSERHRSVGKGAAIGGMTGLVIGALAGMVWGSGDEPGAFEVKPSSEAEGALALGILGLGVGVLLGAMIGAASPRWQTRYSASADPDSSSARR